MMTTSSIKLNLIIKFIFFSFFGIITQSAWGQKIHLINTIDGIDVVFEKAEDLISNGYIYFKINNVNVFAPLDPSDRIRRIKASTYRYEGSEKQYRFKDRERYLFDFSFKGNTLQEKIEYRCPRKHLISIGVNDPKGMGEGRLNYAEKVASDFHKFIAESSFLPDYPFANQKELTDSSATCKSVSGFFDDCKESIRDNDVFIFLFSGHGKKIKEDEEDHFSMVLNEGYYEDIDLADDLKKLPKDSYKIVIIASCHSKLFIKALQDNHIENVTFFYAGEGLVPDGEFGKNLLAKLDSSRKTDFTLYSLATSTNPPGYSQPFLPYNETNNLFLYRANPTEPELKNSITVLPLNIIGKRAVPWKEKGIREKTSIILELASFTSTVTCGIIANDMFRKGSDAKQMNRYAQDYLNQGKNWAAATYVSGGVFIGSYLWHFCEANGFLKKATHERLSLKSYPIINSQYASLGISIAF